MLFAVKAKVGLVGCVYHTVWCTVRSGYRFGRFPNEVGIYNRRALIRHVFWR